MPTDTATYTDMISSVKDTELQNMLSELSVAPLVYQPSKFWIYYLIKNIDQLEENGLENFKQSVNQNYFNWIGDDWITPQQESISKDLSSLTKLLTAWHIRRSAGVEKNVCLNENQWRAYKNFVAILWEFVSKHDKLGILQDLQEPKLGNSLSFKYKGREISQDICNSVLELNGVAEGMSPVLQNANILEVGGGYGRIADVLLRSYPNATITMVDIPPGLHICQWYLSQLHLNRKIFKYRAFNSYAEVKHEYEQASVRFLLPHQLELIPDDSFTACINVSSLHEMTPNQIEHWFNLIDRLVSGCFYTKQWIKNVNTYDNIVIERESYPVKKHWKESYNQVCKVQPFFFEALYKTR